MDSVAFAPDPDVLEPSTVQNLFARNKKKVLLCDRKGSTARGIVSPPVSKRGGTLGYSPPVSGGSCSRQEEDEASG